MKALKVMVIGMLLAVSSVSMAKKNKGKEKGGRQGSSIGKPIRGGDFKPIRRPGQRPGGSPRTKSPDTNE